MLLVGACLVVILLVVAEKSQNMYIFDNFIIDIAADISVIILSIATYDEWERRQERKRYKPPEGLGVDRIKNEIAQLLYQYAFMLNERFSSQSSAS